MKLLISIIALAAFSSQAMALNCPTGKDFKPTYCEDAPPKQNPPLKTAPPKVINPAPLQAPPHPKAKAPPLPPKRVPPPQWYHDDGPIMPKFLPILPLPNFFGMLLANGTKAVNSVGTGANYTYKRVRESF